MKQIFALMDKKAGAMLDPFASLNAATAIREISIKISQDSNLARFSADFQLVKLADWDPEQGLGPPEGSTVVIELEALGDEVATDTSERQRERPTE